MHGDHRGRPNKTPRGTRWFRLDLKLGLGIGLRTGGTHEGTERLENLRYSEYPGGVHGRTHGSLRASFLGVEGGTSTTGIILCRLSVSFRPRFGIIQRLY